jgi:ferritin
LDRSKEVCGRIPLQAYHRRGCAWFEVIEEAEDEDVTVGIFMQQFVTIQLKAVGTYGDLISRYNRCGTNEAAILEFDEYLSEQ